MDFFFVIQLLYGLAAASVGATSAGCLVWSHLSRKTITQTNAEAHHAAGVLVRLEELATRVAFDVDEHSNQVEEINDKLISADEHEPTMIVDVVAKLTGPITTAVSAVHPSPQCWRQWPTSHDSHRAYVSNGIQRDADTHPDSLQSA